MSHRADPSRQKAIWAGIHFLNSDWEIMDTANLDLEAVREGVIQDFEVLQNRLLTDAFVDMYRMRLDENLILNIFTLMDNIHLQCVTLAKMRSLGKIPQKYFAHTSFLGESLYSDLVDNDFIRLIRKIYFPTAKTDPTKWWVRYLFL